MKWKAWRLGAAVSIVLSVFVAMAGVVAGMTWHAFVAVLGAALVSHFGAFIFQHPVDKIEFDTETIVKSSTTTDKETGTVVKESSVETTKTPIQDK